jgi:hypothetical protein
VGETVKLIMDHRYELIKRGFVTTTPGPKQK